nr:MAG TPA: flagellar and swarming motility protein [Caudoviricetes sp.]
MNNFIELHRFDGDPILINTRHITAVVRRISSTKDVLVFFSSAENDIVAVTESYEEVKRLLASVEYVHKEEED